MLDLTGGYDISQSITEMFYTTLSIVFVMGVSCDISPSPWTIDRLYDVFHADILFRPFNVLYNNPLRVHALIKKREECPGYLLIACKDNQYLMSMTVWEREMMTGTGDIVHVQEHALIQKNFFFSHPSTVRNVSLIMHSYAANKINRPFIVCQPYKKMRDIMKNLHHTKERLTELPGEDPCVAFGSDVQIINDESIKRLWSDLLYTAGVPDKISPTKSPRTQSHQQHRRFEQLLQRWISKKKEMRLGASPGIHDFLRDELPSYTGLQKLVLTRIRFTPEQLSTLLSNLSRLPDLRELVFFKNHLGDSGVEMIAPALPLIQKLSALDMDDNFITDKGVEAIVRILPLLSHPIILSLRFNMIGNHGARILIPFLKNKLSRLDLENNIGVDATLLERIRQSR